MMCCVLKSVSICWGVGMDAKIQQVYRYFQSNEEQLAELLRERERYLNGTQALLRNLEKGDALVFYRALMYKELRNLGVHEPICKEDERDTSPRWSRI